MALEVVLADKVEHCRVRALNLIETENGLGPFAALSFRDVLRFAYWHVNGVEQHD